MKNKFLVTSMILLIIVLIANIVFASQEGENNNSNTVNVNKTENNLIENQKNITNNETDNNISDNVRNELNSEELVTKIEESVDTLSTSNTKPLENGKYKIISSLDKNMGLEVTMASKNNGANIQIWYYGGEVQQKFQLEYDGNGYYIIRNTFTNKVLDIENANKNSGANVWQYEYNGTDAQKWKIVKTQDGYYNIISKLSGMYLDVTGGVANYRTNVQVYEPNGTGSQKFELTAVKTFNPQKTLSNGTYKIMSSINTNYGLEVENASTANQANVQLWSYVGGIQQKFKLEYDGNGYYIIRNAYSNKVLDVEGGALSSETNVSQCDYNGTDSQRWIIEKSSDGFYFIVSKQSELYLDVENAMAKDGSNIQVYTGNENLSQKFKIEEIKPMTGEKTLKNGTYRIATSLNNNIGAEVKNSSHANQANVQVWTYDGGNQQKFQLEYDGKGYYVIRNVNSKKVLDVQNAGMLSGTNVWQYDYNGTDSQKWIIKKTQDGYYNIISKLNELCLDVAGGTAKNGANLQVYTPNNTKSQKFKFILKDSQTGQKVLEDGTYRIATSLNTNIGLDVSNASTANQANVQIWKYDNVIQQQFNITYNKNGYYTIIPVHSGKVIDIQGGSNKPGSNVQQYENNGTSAQKWIIKKTDDGYYNIISKLDNLYLDLAKESSANGTNVQVSEEDGSKSQKFQFVKVADKSEKTITDGNYRIALGNNNSMGLDISNGSTQNMGNVQIWKYDESIQQKFEVVYEEDGYYIIRNIKSGKVLDVADGGTGNGTNVWQYEYNGTDAQKWIIRSTTDGHYNIISKASGLCLDIQNAEIKNGANVQIYENNGTSAQKFDFIKVNIGVNIDEAKYPGIQEKVNEIAKKHPNWNFEILYTGLDFNTAVAGEYSDKNRNLVSPSVYQGEWISPDPVVSGGWYSASQKGIAYFMDIRNFLNDVDVFQFLDVNSYSSNSVTLQGIANETAGTFLQGFENDINNACKSQGVNPYFVLARLFQEQGTQGSEIGTGMKGPDGKTYYNPYNIGAVTGNEYETALATAMANGWDTMQKALEAGIVFLKEDWLENYQNTLYQNKFDIDTRNGSALYTHQYMQNLSAAYSEGRTLRNIYADTNKLESEFTFIIPVYENMPQEPSPKPSNEGGVPGVNSDKGPVNVKTVNINDVPLKLRDEPNTNGDVIAEFPNNGTILLSVERLSNGWHRIVTKDGDIGYSSGSYLQTTSDETNNNDKVMVKTKDNIGINLRYGPSTTFTPPIASYPDGTIATRISKGYYNFDGFSWDEVVFSDGNKGFVPTNYLQVVN